MTLVSRFGLAARLARRELRSGLRGVGVFVGCLWLGVFAIAAVGSVSAAARQGIRVDARSILGGDLELQLTHRPADPEVLDRLASWGRTATVLELRAMARPGPETGSRAGPVLVEAKAVDEAYPLYGDLELDPPLPLREALATGGGPPGAVVDANPGDWIKAVSRLDDLLGGYPAGECWLHTCDGRAWYWKPAMRRRLWKRVVPLAHQLGD